MLNRWPRTLYEDVNAIPVSPTANNVVDSSIPKVVCIGDDAGLGARIWDLLALLS